MDALSHLLNTGEGVVLDRCVYSADVFTDTLVEVGLISKHGKKCSTFSYNNNLSD